MRYILFVTAVVVAAFTYASGQVQDSSLEKGKIEDLKGIIKVYVATPNQSSSSATTLTIIETVRKGLPQLMFVSLREEADVWLLFSVETGTETESNSDPSLEGRSSIKFVNVLRSQGKVIRARVSSQAKLVKKFSETGRSSDGIRLARDFAEEFIKLYLKANPGSQADVARLQLPTSLPPRQKGQSDPVTITGKPTSVGTAAGAAEVADGDILRTDTSLVTIQANVIGRDGRPAPELRQDDFSIYEDDVKQDIAFFEPVERPFSVVLLIDSSTSVDPQLGEILKAARVLIERLRPDDQLAIVTFNKNIKEMLKLTKIRDLRGEPIKISPEGGTRLYDAVDFAASRYLRRLPGRKAVVLLTDGVDVGSFKTTAERSLHVAEEYDALFYTVQYKTSADPLTPAEEAQLQYEFATAYLRELAEKTGGRYQRAENMTDLSPAFASVVKELSCQYSLGYYPRQPPQPGERRRIRVRVSRSDLVIHARDSYVFKAAEAKQAKPK